MRLVILASVLVISVVTSTYCVNIKGFVLDGNTQEAMVGATVLVVETQKGTMTDLDGSFTIKDLNENTKYTLEVSFLGYASKKLEIIAGKEVFTIFIEENKQILSEVVVTASYDTESELSSRFLERKADNVLNVIGAKAILISPDITVANVVQRVSGVSLERNSNGDGQHAIVRGMDKRYNYTLVNGVKIPSPDNKYRYVPLDIFPADLLDRLEVIKSLTPEYEGDAIGGAINLVMKNAPTTTYFTANISTGFSELFTQRPYASYQYKDIPFKSPYELNERGYNAQLSDFNFSRVNVINGNPKPNLVGSVAYGKRILEDRLGFILAASYQNTYRGSNSLFFESQVVDTDRTSTITKMFEREFSEQQTRYGVHLKTDFVFKKNHKLEWYNAFLNLDNIQTRDSKATEFSFGYFPELGNSNLAYATRLRLTKQQIINSTLKGDHSFGKFKMNYSIAIASATNQIPDNTNIELLGAQKNFVESITFPRTLNRRWERNKDNDQALYLNLKYPVSIGTTNIDWTVGGLIRNKNRENFYNNYAFTPADPFALFGDSFKKYDEINWRLVNPRGAVATALSYNADELVAAGYAQFKFTKWSTDFVGGLRTEYTDQGYEMVFPIGEDRPVGNSKYTELLPSFQSKFMLKEKVNLRFSYFRSLNRPGFFEIVPYRIVNEEFTERGNPDLKISTAQNFDLRYEYFPKPNEQFMAGVFYKFIKNPIEYTLVPDAVRGQTIFYQPGNFGDATNYGLELDFIKYLGKFGLKANYTLTNSSITTLKSIRVRNAQGDLTTIQEFQTRPLFGQSRHVYNTTLMYKNSNKGWDAQIAASYTGKRIFTVSQFLDNDLWQDGFMQVDASVDKSINKKIILFAKANNLLNTPLRVYIKNVNSKNDGLPFQEKSINQTLVREDFYNRAYLVGLRLKFL